MLRHFVRSGLFALDWGLTFTSARVFVRGPCVSCALVPTLAVLPPHVCRHQGTGLTPLARTCKSAITKRTSHVPVRVCYYEGSLKQFNAPSARMVKINQHVESFQSQFLHKEAVLLVPFKYAQSHSSSNQHERSLSSQTATMLNLTKLKESDQPTQPVSYVSHRSRQKTTFQKIGDNFR